MTTLGLIVKMLTGLEKVEPEYHEQNEDRVFFKININN